MSFIIGRDIAAVPGAVARSEASPLGMPAAPSSIPTSGTFFRGDVVMKKIIRPFSLFRFSADSKRAVVSYDERMCTEYL